MSRDIAMEIMISFPENVHIYSTDTVCSCSVTREETCQILPSSNIYPHGNRWLHVCWLESHAGWMLVGGGRWDTDRTCYNTFAVNIGTKISITGISEGVVAGMSLPVVKVIQNVGIAMRWPCADLEVISIDVKLCFDISLPADQTNTMRANIVITGLIWGDIIASSKKESSIIIIPSTVATCTAVIRTTSITTQEQITWTTTIRMTASSTAPTFSLIIDVIDRLIPTNGRGNEQIVRIVSSITGDRVKVEGKIKIITTVPSWPTITACRVKIINSVEIFVLTMATCQWFEVWTVTAAAERNTLASAEDQPLCIKSKCHVVHIAEGHRWGSVNSNFYLCGRYTQDLAIAARISPSRCNQTIIVGRMAWSTRWSMTSRCHIHIFQIISTSSSSEDGPSSTHGIRLRIGINSDLNRSRPWLTTNRVRPVIKFEVIVWKSSNIPHDDLIIGGIQLTSNRPQLIHTCHTDLNVAPLAAVEWWMEGIGHESDGYYHIRRIISAVQSYIAHNVAHPDR